MKLFKSASAVTICVISIFYTLAANAQGLKISGFITDSLTHQAVSNVTVYIGNSLISTSANSGGYYVLDNLKPGAYTLVTSCIGYSPAQVQVNLTRDETINISLKTQVTELAEVNVRANNNWYRDLGLFTRYFLTGSEYSSLCRIANSNVLTLDFKNNILTAGTKDFLIVENKALGYRVKFLINEYTVDVARRTFHYNGIAIFEELNGSEKEKKNWIQLRENVFKASFKGFLYAIARNKVTEDGFIVRRFLRYDNPDRPSDSVLVARMQYLNRLPSTKAVRDSIAEWKKIFNLPKKVEQVIGPVLTVKDLVKPSKEAGLTDLVFDDYIYVIYKKKRIRFEDNLYRTREASDNQLSIIQNKDIANPVKFTTEGLQITKGALFFDGAWGDPSVTNMLPNDYLPEMKK